MSARVWTHYWTTRTADATAERVRASSDARLRSISSNLFVSRGIGPGDTIYAISYRTAELRVLARLVVAEIVDTSAARRLLKREPFDASDHAIATAGSTTLRFDAIVPVARVPKLEFVSNGRVIGPKLRPDGLPDQQTFRGVRQITDSSGDLLDEILMQPALAL